MKLTPGVTYWIGQVDVSKLPVATVKSQNQLVNVKSVVYANPQAVAREKTQATQPGFVPPGEQAKIITGSSSTPTYPSPFTVSSNLILDGAPNDGANTCSCTPPDPDVAVGPNHVFEIVNVAGIIYFKTGMLAKATFSLSTFFNLPVSSMSDPQILYDAGSGRWFASILDIPDGRVQIAVSTSNDPTGTFNLYFVATAGPSVTPDHPWLGESDDKIIILAYDFNPAFIGTQYWVLNKAELVAGAATIDFSTGTADTLYASVHPARHVGSTSGLAYMVEMAFGSTSTARLFAISGVPPGPVTVTTNSFAINPISNPPNGVQPDPSPVDTNDDHIVSAVWEANTLWFAAIDACIPNGDTVTRSCLRFIQLTTAGTTPPTKVQDFDYASAGQYLFYPALSLASGSLVVVYGLSSSTIYPSLLVTGRLSTDPLNTLQAPFTIKAGSAPNNNNRYGDYFGAATDPTPSAISTFWVAGEYRMPTTLQGWSTAIARVPALNIPVANPGTWSTKTPFPAVTEGLGAATVGGIVYAISGFPTLTSFYAYDPATNTYSAKAPLPISVSEPAGVVSLNGLVYVISGFIKDFVGCSGGAANCLTNATQVYNPSTNTWSQAAQIPTRRDRAGTVALGTKIYVIGGYQITGAVSPSLNVVEAYDSVANTWSTLTPMPTAREGLLAAVIGGKIYAIGGLTNPTVGTSATGVVEVYDATSNTWSTGFSQMPSPRGVVMGATLCSDTIFIVGGVNSAGPPVAINQAYIPASDSWITHPAMPTARAEGTAATLGNTMYVVGGFTASPGNGDTNVNEAYTVTCSTNTTTFLFNSNGIPIAIGGSVSLGTSVHDNATVNPLAPGVPMSGTVTYTFFSNNACSGAGSSAGGGTPIAGIAPSSSIEGPLAAGSYSFISSYTGDSNYSGSTSSCEHFVVLKSAPSIGTALYTSSGVPIPIGGSVPFGTSVYDNATIVGAVPGFPITGNINYTVYRSGDCTGASGMFSPVPVGSHSPETGPLPAETDSFRATYLGDSDYSSVTSSCEPFTVLKGSTMTGTVLYYASRVFFPVGSSVPVGTLVYDNATVIGTMVPGNTMGGVVTFVFFTNNACSGTGTLAGGGQPSGGAAVVSSREGPLAVGSYSFQASFSGDNNYLPSTGPCEPFNVFDFSMTNPSDVTVNYAGVAPISINIAAAGVQAQSMSLSCGGLSVGVRCFSFYPSSGVPPFTSILTVTFTNSTESVDTSVTVTVIGNESGLIHMTQFTMHIPNGSVGGETIPVDKLRLIAPYATVLAGISVISLLSLVIVVRRVKLSNEKRGRGKQESG